MHIFHLISHNTWGGSRRYALDICTHFRNAGHKVVALTRDARAVDDRFAAAGIHTLHAPLHGFFDPASAWLLANLLKRVPAGEGVVHVHRYRDAFTALLAKRIARRPDIRVVSTRHYVRPGRNSRLFRRIYAKVDAHIFVSQTAYDRFASTWQGKPPIPEGRSHVILNSVPAMFGDVPAEPQRGPIIALCAGSVVHGKGIENAIDALATLRDLKIRLRIAGAGNPDYLDSLRRRAMSRGVMEMIDWRISPDIPPQLYADAHFCVQPSVEREAFGLDNLAAMAAGRPQVCSPNGAQREFLEDEATALFVPPANPEALASAMRRLATDPDLRHRLAHTALQTYNTRLSWSHFITLLQSLYTGSYDDSF